LSRFEVIDPGSLGRPRGYSHGMLAPAGGRVLLVAGQIGWDAEQKLVGPGFVAQFERALANVLEVVRAAGGAAEDVGRLTIFVADRAEYLGDLEAVGEAYRRVLGRHYPAMSLVEVAALLEPGARVEIEATAVLPAPGAPRG
jgi:enamine deaminase RidA (YjgF/YER057c/UK114 family)